MADDDDVDMSLLLTVQSVSELDDGRDGRKARDERCFTYPMMTVSCEDSEVETDGFECAECLVSGMGAAES